eukprot:3807136-Pyramimonas_sp.AAC.1
MNMYMICFAFFLDTGPKASHHRQSGFRQAKKPLVQFGRQRCDHIWTATHTRRQCSTQAGQ